MKVRVELAEMEAAIEGVREEKEEEIRNAVDTMEATLEENDRLRQEKYYLQVELAAARAKIRELTAG